MSSKIEQVTENALQVENLVKVYAGRGKEPVRALERMRDGGQRTTQQQEYPFALPTGNKRELLAQRVANELLADKGLSDATYASAAASFSTEELVALIARVGSFSMTCCTANAFDITPPDDAPDRLKT